MYKHSARRACLSGRQGFTLLEVLLVISLLGVITAVTIPMYFRYQIRSDLSNASSMIAQGVDRARVLAQAGYQDSAWGFSIEHGVLFKGTSYEERDTAYDEYYPINTTIVPSGTTEVWFDKITGQPNAPGSIITLTGNDGGIQSIDLELNEVGSPVMLSDRIPVCHLPNSDLRETVYVSDAMLSVYLAQGDTQGPCPALSSSAASVASSVASSAAASSVASSTAASSVASNVASSAASSAAASSSTPAAVATKGIYLLATSGQGTLNVSGNGTLTISSPGFVTVNSNNSAAVTVSGNGRIISSDYYIVGNSGRSVTSNGIMMGTLHSGAAAASDPLASLAEPTPDSNTLSSVTVSGNSSTTIGPNTYQGISVSGNARLTLNPGTYYLKGNLSVSGNGQLTGSGVTIYKESGTISLSGNGQITLRPPSTGTYAGVTIFQKRTLTSALSISGNGNLSIRGALYAPAGAFTLSGNGASNALASLIVGKSLSMTGNASFTIQ